MDKQSAPYINGSMIPIYVMYSVKKLTCSSRLLTTMHSVEINKAVFTAYHAISNQVAGHNFLHKYPTYSSPAKHYITLAETKKQCGPQVHVHEAERQSSVSSIAALKSPRRFIIIYNTSSISEVWPLSDSECSYGDKVSIEKKACNHGTNQYLPK